MKPAARDTGGALLLAMFPTVGLLLLNGLWNPPLYRWSPAAFWGADVLTHVLVPGAMLVYLARRHAVRPGAYGVGRPGSDVGELIALTVIATALMWMSYKPVAAFFGHLLHSEAGALTYIDVMPDTTGARLAVAVYFSASAALFEEVMYRGLPYLYCTQRFARTNVVPAYVLSSAVLFGLAHWENGVHEIIATTCLGVVACILYTKIRTLWPLIGAHFLINLLSFG